MLIDRFGRKITYLRVSVTDRCNYRCVYCMPQGGVPRKVHSEILTYEEMMQIIRVMVQEGIRRVRLTGGEPLVRRGLEVLVRQMAELPGLEEVSLTTNGALLGRMAETLTQAGLKRVNVSLDTLKSERFARITRGGDLSNVLQGIQKAEEAGLNPIKLNAVVVRGVNDDEIADLARLTLDHPWEVRFIEVMPVGNSQDWGEGFPPENRRFVSATEMLERLSALDLERMDVPTSDGPAREYRIRGAKGRLGFISPISNHFCSNCNRLRLTSDGFLRPCLLLDREINLRDALRRGEDLLPLIEAAVREKPEGHELDQLISPSSRHMFDIGG